MTTTKTTIYDLYEDLRKHKLISKCYDSIELVKQTPIDEIHMVFSGEKVTIQQWSSTDYKVVYGFNTYYAEHRGIIAVLRHKLMDGHKRQMVDLLRECKSTFSYQFTYKDISSNVDNTYTYEALVPLKEHKWWKRSYCKIYVMFLITNNCYWISVCDDKMKTIAEAKGEKNLGGFLYNALLMQNYVPINAISNFEGLQ
jgi:hypothetical protein